MQLHSSTLNFGGNSFPLSPMSPPLAVWQCVICPKKGGGSSMWIHACKSYL